MVIFPGDPPFRMEPLLQRSKGDPFDLAVMSMSTHLGTHVDPPAHYLDGGYTVDQIPVETLVGPGIVLDMTGRGAIDREALRSSDIGDHTRVLFKTDNAARLLGSSFSEEYVYLTEDGAQFLVDHKVCLVGIDHLSIERYMNPGAPVHRELLKAGVLIVEGVNLLEVPAGPCEIYCLPLRIVGADGAPARILIRT